MKSPPLPRGPPYGPSEASNRQLKRVHASSAFSRASHDRSPPPSQAKEEWRIVLSALAIDNEGEAEHLKQKSEQERRKGRREVSEIPPQIH